MTTHQNKEILGNLIIKLPKNQLFLEEGKYLKVSVGDNLKGKYLVTFDLVKVLTAVLVEQI